MKNDKKVLSWALYDWANSAYSTTVTAGFFPLFYKGYWSAGADSIVTTTRLGDLTATAGFIVAILTPGLGALADRRESKKTLLLIFMLIGALGCLGLGLAGEGQWQLVSLIYTMTVIGFNGSTSFYDSLLPSVARGREHSASALGFSLGYLGGGVLFLINVLMYLNPSWFGISDSVRAVQLSFMSVGIWWLLFSVPLFMHVPEPSSGRRDGSALLPVIYQSFSSVFQTGKRIMKDRNVFLFLLAFWLYIDGVYTVIAMAVDFGLSLGFDSKHLIAALLLVQFTGFPSALLFGRLGERAGKSQAKRLILICLGIYSLTTIAASHMTEIWHFYALAFTVGLVQGGVQSLSRSIFARIIPADRSGEYFGFMNLIGKFAAIMGPFLVARTAAMTGNHRSALQSLLILFFLGAFFLSKTHDRRPSQ